MLSIGFGAAIRSFLNSTRPLIVDVALLKGIYIGTNLLADAERPWYDKKPRKEVGESSRAGANGEELVLMEKTHRARAKSKGVSLIAMTLKSLCEETEDPRMKELGINELGGNMMDGNNQIIPIATGVCEGKSKESWSWFLNNLKESVDEVLKQEVSKKLVDAGFEKWYSYVQSLLDGLTVVNWLNLGLEKPHSKLHTKRWYITKSFRRDIVIHMPEDLQDVLPPVMEKHQSGLPKNKDRIQSQGERKNNICHVLVLGQPNANGRKGVS
ncbi:hypothetical protein Tco_0630636 [Tanacetum coccineum]